MELDFIETNTSIDKNDLIEDVFDAVTHRVKPFLDPHDGLANAQVRLWTGPMAHVALAVG
jgi:hypothetical protein